ncbi:MAG TPA: hypothetical protein VMV93_14085 [Chloroflexota bacterium]|nr:hypothetical protein [Chloroflexota bacterium]
MASFVPGSGFPEDPPASLVLETPEPLAPTGQGAAPEPDANGREEARSTRFARPPEPDYNLSPAEHLEIRNSNLPLTLGLLFSVSAAFVVFFVSMVGGAAGTDPVLPSFWRSLSALAVFTTLSFVVSWFMPAPSERRLQLAKLEQEQADDPFGDRDFGEVAPEAAAPEASGTELAPDDELDEYDDEDEDDVNAQAAMGGR